MVRLAGISDEFSDPNQGGRSGAASTNLGTRETHSDHTCIINFSQAHAFFRTNRCRSGFKTSMLLFTEVSTSSPNRLAILYADARSAFVARSYGV